MTGQDWEKLATAGFNRFSIGIQDFNKQVLQTVHRQTPLLQPEEIVTILRSYGVRINMDFLYGLPHQTEASFAETIEKAVSLKPDRLVTFSYAHVPWAFPRQKVLEKPDCLRATRRAGCSKRPAKSYAKRTTSRSG